MIVRAALAAALVLALTASTTDPLAGRIAGKPEQCLDLDRIDGPDIVDAHTILYRQNGRRVWRTGPIGSCPALRPPDTLIVEVYSRQLCRGDRFRVLQSGTAIPSGYCRFGEFTPYDKPHVEKPDKLP